MFAFTSMGGRVDHGINKTSGPCVFKVSSQIYYVVESLLPTEGKCQGLLNYIYIYNTGHELYNRLSLFKNDSPIDETIVHNLIEILNFNNEIVKSFRMARDRFLENDFAPIKLKLIGKYRRFAICKSNCF